MPDCDPEGRIFSVYPSHPFLYKDAYQRPLSDCIVPLAGLDFHCLFILRRRFIIIIIIIIIIGWGGYSPFADLRVFIWDHFQKLFFFVYQNSRNVLRVL